MEPQSTSNMMEGTATSILSSTTSIYEQETTPNFIKIKLAELKPNLSGGGFNKELALIPFPKESTTSSLTWYEVKNKEYFKLASSCLSNISVQLIPILIIV